MWTDCSPRTLSSMEMLVACSRRTFSRPLLFYSDLFSCSYSIATSAYRLVFTSRSRLTSVSTVRRCSSSTSCGCKPRCSYYLAIWPGVEAEFDCAWPPFLPPAALLLGEELAERRAGDYCYCLYGDSIWWLFSCCILSCKSVAEGNQSLSF